MRHRGPPAAARHRARPPEERSLTEARFVGTFPRADAPLDPPLPEVALVGRSNVGKSSLLNALAGRRIAKVSGTPGKTRMMNVYEIPLVRGTQCAVADGADRAPGAPGEQPRPAHRALYLLDLPGYGWSRASKSERAAFQRLVRHALERPRLAGVLWLLDMRHEPSADDRTMQALLAARHAPVLAALTKSDKLPRSRGRRREQELRDTLLLDADQVIATSARTGAGVDELRLAIEELVTKATE